MPGGISVLLGHPLPCGHSLRWFPCSFAGTAITKHHGLHGVNNGKVFVSQSWRLEVQGQGVGRVDYFQGLCPGVAAGSLLSVPSEVIPLSIRTPDDSSSFYKDISQIGSGSILMTSF